MRKGLVLVAAGVMVAVVLFDIAPESVEVVGLIATIGLLLAGASVALGFQFNKQRSRTGLISPLSLAFWFHSLLEGALVATSIRLDPHLGSFVLVGVLLHLLPEIVAVTVLLQRLGSSLRQAAVVSVITIGVLMTSFTAFKFIPASETPLQILTTIIGGVLLYICTNVIYQQLKSHGGAYDSA